MPARRDPNRPVKGFAPEAWRLWCALDAARARHPYQAPEARLLDGLAYWVRWEGRGKPVPGPWWALACALTAAVARALSDPDTAALLAPWAGAAQPNGTAARSGFAPFGAPDLDGRPGPG